jgi:cytoskeleton protein RodZ
MGSFGDRLKKEREQRGITLDDISLTTKIGTRLLRALEEEKFEQLPGGIFNKGFVRAYARHVGLDEDQAVADYMSAVGANQVKPVEEVFPVQVPAARPPEPDPGPRIHVVRQARREPAAEVPWGLLAILLLVVALAFASWSYFHREPQVEKDRVVPASTTQPAPATGSTPDVPSPPAGPSSANPQPLPVHAAEGPTGGVLPNDEAPHSQGAPVQQAALSQPIPTQGSEPASGTFTVRLEGNEESEECWVSITVDGKPPVEAILAAPEEKTIQANREVVVRAGSVGALDFFFNGKKIPAQGDYGKVKTLVFRADGLQAPPPKPPSPVQ